VGTKISFAAPSKTSVKMVLTGRLMAFAGHVIKAPKTKAGRLRYLREALKDLNYELSFST